MPEYDQVTLGSKILRVFGSTVWNNLSYHIKSFENLKLFKEVIKNQNDTFCACIVCTK